MHSDHLLLYLIILYCLKHFINHKDQYIWGAGTQVGEKIIIAFGLDFRRQSVALVGMVARMFLIFLETLTIEGSR